MNITYKSLIILAVLAVGGVLGASAISAFAQTGQWTAPECPPPGCNIDAPINVGSSEQKKTGSLLVGLSDTYAVTGGIATGNLQIFGNLIFNPGTTVNAGDVLVAKDNLGTVGWAAPGASGSCSNTPITLTSDTVYQNTTGKKLLVSGYANSSSGSANHYSSVIGYMGTSNTPSTAVSGDYDSDTDRSVHASISFIVPPNSYYKIIVSQSGSIKGSVLQAWEMCN